MSIFADNAPEKLSSPADIRTFQEVTRRLNCFCGCHGLVSECLHVDEHCFAVQTRRFIENRILDGRNADEIVDGFVSGFGEEAWRDPLLQEWARKGRQDLISGVVDGFGPSILHHNPPDWPVYISLAGGLLIFGLLIWRLWALKLSPADALSAAGPAQNHADRSAVSADVATEGEDWLGKARSQIDELDR
ncbi:MAG: hypothetical protein KDK25_02200 [Leptospiraceae bacterium]|nr:hypothetical protein [Leptospiraceae bacterium]